jgi:hypothetical protein
MTSRPGFRLPIAGPARRCELRNGPRRDGFRRDNLVPRSAPAVGNINGSDRIVAEPVSPPDTPQVIMIRWPQPSTVVAPTRFPSTASEIARVVRTGEYRFDSDQGTPTLPQPQAGPKDLILTAAACGSRIKVSGSERSIGLSVSRRGLLARALQPASPIPAR